MRFLSGSAIVRRASRWNACRSLAWAAAHLVADKSKGVAAGLLEIEATEKAASGKTVERIVRHRANDRANL